MTRGVGTWLVKAVLEQQTVTKLGMEEGRQQLELLHWLLFLLMVLGQMSRLENQDKLTSIDPLSLSLSC